MYNLLDNHFENAMKRDLNTVRGLWSKKTHEVMFRRSKDKNLTNNTAEIFYRRDTGLKQGELIEFRGKIFMLLNQEELSNPVYLSSDIIMCNGYMSMITSITGQPTNAYEIGIHIVSSDLSSPGLQGGSVIQVVGGSLHLRTEDNSDSRQVRVGAVFPLFGGAWKVINVVFINGIANIYVDRAMDNEVRLTEYSFHISLPNDFDIEETYSLDRYAYPTARIQNTSGSWGVWRTIINATVFWESSDESIATVDENNILHLHQFGEFTLMATWVQHGLTDSASAEIIEPFVPNPYTIITYDGLPEIRISGSARIFTCEVYEPDGTRITNINNLTFTWSDTAVSPIVLTRNTSVRGQISIGATGGVGNHFALNVNVTGTDGRTYEPSSVPSILVRALF